ncbi:MAG: hypothetical protein AB1722_08525 [Pseudomonadota bacterium]
MKGWLVALLLWVGCLAGVAVAAGVQEFESQVAFKHFKTGYPLTGAHRQVDCAVCHVGGMFRGTPRNCEGCHRKGMRVVAMPMPDTHMPTNEPCEVCHTSTTTFLGARFDHASVSPDRCTECHNGRIATGKPASHRAGLMLQDSCWKCHRPVGWLPARFDHTGVVSGSCAQQCHNGTLATGRPASHTTVLKATSSCDACHRFFAWYPTFYNHGGVVPGSCATACHNGVEATGKPAGHTGLKGSMTCDQCHSTIGWSPAHYNHVGVAPGACATCHNGAASTGVPANHTGVRLQLACDNCHTTAAWLPASYNHAGVAPGTCLTCHAAQRPASHAARGYMASCDACHTIASWAFNHALQQGKHTCNSCHAFHHNETPCDYCHSVNGWGGHH